MNKAVLLLGSNTGERHLNLSDALSQIRQDADAIIQSSSIFETEPWGNPAQPYYLNTVIELATQKQARQLLEFLLSIEEKMGRRRNGKWSPRNIDIDILYFNDEIINEPGLTIPHKHLHERKFALQPLVDILPDGIHPVFKKSNSELLSSLRDDLKVSVFESKIISV